MDVRFGLLRKLSSKELMLLNCGCWRRVLRVSWTARKSKQSILKEISPEYSLEELMLKLKLQYFDYLMWRTNSLGKTLMLRKIGGGKRRDWYAWMASLTRWTGVWVNSRVGDGQRRLACCIPWNYKELDMTEWLNWTDLNGYIIIILFKRHLSHVVYMENWIRRKLHDTFLVK